MAANDFEPRPAAYANRRVGRGLAILGLGVAVFVFLMLAALVVFGATQFNDRIVDGRQSVEFAEGRWQILAPYRELDAEVVVTDSDGRDVPVNYNVHPAEQGALVVEDGREWTPTGRIDIPADGTYTVDAGDLDAHFRQVDFPGFFIALGLGATALVAGVILFVLGLVVMTSRPAGGTSQVRRDGETASTMPPRGSSSIGPAVSSAEDHIR